jgi:hypothetical protein
MADDAGPVTPAYEWDRVPACPWCSAVLPSPDTTDCPSCEARLVEPLDVVIPGVTAVDPVLLAAAAAPRKVKRTFGSLLVGDDNEIPPPSEAEMPALARPDAEVRREILRLEMEAKLIALRAEVASRSADGAVSAGPSAESPEPPEDAELPDRAEAGEPPEDAELPDPAEVGEPPEPPASVGPPADPGEPPDPA